MGEQNRQGASPSGLMGYGAKARRQAANIGDNEMADELSTLGTADVNNAATASRQAARVGQTNQRTTANLRGEFRPH